MVRRPRLAFTALFLLGSTAHAGDVKPIRVTYIPHVGCPGEAEFLREVRQVAGRLRLAEGDEPAREVRVTFEGDDDVVHTGHLLVADGGVFVGSRDVEGAGCSEVARLLAFALALTYDPDAFPETSPEASSPAPALPPATAEPVPLAPPLPPSPASSRDAEAKSSVPPSSGSLSAGRPARSGSARLGFGLAAHATVASDLSPHPTFGGGLSGELDTTLRQLPTSFRLGLEYVASAPARTDGALVELALAYAWLEGCAVPLNRRLSVAACARLDAGVRIAQGQDIPDARTVPRPWVALGPTAHLRVRIAGPAFVDLGAGLFVPIVNDTVSFAPTNVAADQVYKVGFLGFRGDLGAGVVFW
jgi:hypothetical protein